MLYLVNTFIAISPDLYLEHWFIAVKRAFHLDV